ncbi:protein grindelwald [Odontomachus brunneus]|uniref:protein grindelwald n=1 Tax=Odontomachus brunneus TaxID=486640 RepID=UPI0013F21220|nr:protein grindelwald [Odontomachus brunneus]XP_032668733.1 protein grindelwald [Odontomachus brunneus]
MFPDVTVNRMTLLVVAIVSLSVLSPALAENFDLHGAKCGSKRCSISEFCSPYDTHCRPCSDACDADHHNFQPDECAKDCQVYLHDQRYVLRTDIKQYDDLRDEVKRLQTMFTVTTTLSCLLLCAVLYLLGRPLLKWKKIQNTLRVLFRKNWVKKATNKNKVQDDVESNGTKQNGLKINMPTISATVEMDTSNGNSNDTPNTTSTSLSRRHPSEDTTLDYAYDNPAMTPSPEAAQLRTKRESSF